MVKIKTVRSADQIQWVIRSQKGQQLGEREVYLINNNEVNGLLHLQVEKKASAFKLIYNISGFVTLKQFLETPLNQERFALILNNVLSVLKSMQNAYFNQQCVLMDFDKVLVNPATQHIYFAYIPIPGIETGASLREFLLNIIQHATFVQGEDRSYVKNYITILNRGINFSVFELEEYIKALSGQSTAAEAGRECPQCHTVIKRDASYCPICGAKVIASVDNSGKGIYDPLSDGETQSEAAYESPNNGRNTQGLSDGTTVLGMDPDATTVLGSNELDNPVFPYLVREKNQEKISVNKPSFRIGKEKKYCDYFVSDNNAISRSHADIVTRDKRYYIIDLNSTNKTYVDGRAIQIDKEIEIFSGTKLRLANEDFVFFIE